MPCEYCGKYGTHHLRCPLYEPPRATHYCSICNEGIYDGEEYLDNIRDMLLNYCSFMDEVNEWKRLFCW